MAYGHCHQVSSPRDPTENQFAQSSFKTALISISLSTSPVSYYLLDVLVPQQDEEDVNHIQGMLQDLFLQRLQTARYNGSRMYSADMLS